jgi:hypothetical protein
MSLAPGTRLGPYEILSPLGAGGMGAVWRARDSKLARDVALRVLPDHLSDDPRALARFENEAKVVAALSHPHILAIYDFGRIDGVSFAVTELLDGETLRAMLVRGALPLPRLRRPPGAGRGLRARRAGERGDRSVEPGPPAPRNRPGARSGLPRRSRGAGRQLGRSRGLAGTAGGLGCPVDSRVVPGP